MTINHPLIINSSINNNYNEGIRITRAGNSWAGITFGSTGDSGAPSGGWFVATNPSNQFILNPDDSGNTAGLTLNKGGDLKWRNNTVIHSGNISSQNVATSKYPYGLAGWQNTNNWINNSDVNFTHLFCWQDGYGGEAGFWTNKSGQMYMAIDGAFYQRRDSGGCWRVLDTHDFNGTISWSNVTSKPAYVSNNSTSIVFTDTQSTGTNSSGFRIGRFDEPLGSVKFQFGQSGSAFQIIDYQWTKALFSFTNTGNLTAAGSIYVNSDRHLKKDVKNINKDHLEELFIISDKLLKEFNWKDNGKHSYGFIAQELQKYIPEAVDLDENHNILSVSYNIAYAKMLASIVNEVKKLKAEVRSLKQHN